MINIKTAINITIFCSELDIVRQCFSLSVNIMPLLVNKNLLNLLVMKLFQKLLFSKLTVTLVLITFAGCQTSKIAYIEREDFPPDKIYRISMVYMKDGSIIDLKDKNPVYKLKSKGIENIIVYDDKEKSKTIRLNDIERIKIEIIESNTVLNVLIIVGSVVLFFLILFIILGPPEGNITG